MVFGHNTNIKLGTVTYHVQTENRGESHALIDTTVYFRGRVLHRRTNNYYDLLPLNDDNEQALKLRLDEQHRTVLEEMRNGTLELALPPAALTPADAPLPPQEPAQEPSANQAQPSAEEVPAPAIAETPAIVREPRKFLLELLNAKSWLSGKHAHLQVAVKEEDGSPVAGAPVIVEIEGAAGHGLQHSVTGEAGTTEVQFEMPRITGREPALVLRAETPYGSGQLRFALRAKSKVPVV
ncbi:MAG: hypothetical protein ABSG77_06295 [Candidatus Acidiferrum sp.]|jgi:hypothetical protein